MRKVQTPLVISQATRARIEALAVVRTETRAEVTRVALEGGGLRALERQHAAELAELAQIAHRFALAGGVTELAERMLDDRLTLGEVRGQGSYPGAGIGAAEPATRRTA